MASKYAAVFARLQKTLNTDPKHQEKVNAVKGAMQGEAGFKQQAAYLAAGYAAARREMDAINAVKSECQVRLDAIFQLMCTQFEVEGTTALTLDDGDNVRIQPKLYISVEDAEAFRQWCLQDPDLQRKMVLHPATAQSLVANMLTEGLSEPPGTKATFVDQAVFTKGH